MSRLCLVGIWQVLGPGNATAAGALTWAQGFLRPSLIWAVSSLSPCGGNPSIISQCLFSLEKVVVLSVGWWLAGLLLCWRFLGPFVLSDFSHGGQVAGSPRLPCSILRDNRMTTTTSNRGGLHFCGFVFFKIVAHGPPLYFPQLPSIVVASLS